jgi:pyruvate/2-oxoglutarate dehydrogenase complex dihydrolipoamide dehydrogenase (E3) component
MSDRALCSNVTVVEAQDRILPLYDVELTKLVAASLRKGLPTPRWL